MVVYATLPVKRSVSIAELPNMLDRINLSELMPPAQFEQEHPNLFQGRDALKIDSLIRQRKINGLEDAGAVIEISPKRFLVVIPRFTRCLEFRRSGRYSQGVVRVQ
jgi:hypothetical protein